MKEDTLKKYMSNIIFQIRDLRKKNGLTQVEFARRVGVGLRFLRELEQGKTTVRMDKLIQVLDFLGYHLELKKNGLQLPASPLRDENRGPGTTKHPKTDLSDTQS